MLIISRCGHPSFFEKLFEKGGENFIIPALSPTSPKTLTICVLAPLGGFGGKKQGNEVSSWQKKGERNRGKKTRCWPKKQKKGRLFRQPLYYNRDSFIYINPPQTPPEEGILILPTL
jgi:hypothetical protein